MATDFQRWYDRHQYTSENNPITRLQLHASQRSKPNRWLPLCVLNCACERCQQHTSTWGDALIFQSIGLDCDSTSEKGGSSAGGIKKVSVANVISFPPAYLISLKSTQRSEKVRCQGRSTAIHTRPSGSIKAKKWPSIKSCEPLR